MNYKEIKDILPEHNEGMHVVPQILTNRAEDFLAIAKELGNYGYESVNLNLGCPSGTVVAKHRGAGFLAVPEKLDHFLEEIFAECPLRISVKTRVGVNDAGEWEHLLSIYEKYPMEELIIHPRVQKDFYNNTPDMEAFLYAVENSRHTLCYNGHLLRGGLPDMETADGRNKEMCFYAGIRAADGSGGHWQPGVPSHAWKRSFKKSGSDRRTHRTCTNYKRSASRVS